MAVAQIGAVLVARLIVQAGIQKLLPEGLLPDMAEAGKKRIGETDRLSAYLIGILEVGKEKESILLDRATHVHTRIPPDKEGIDQPLAQLRIVEAGIERAGIVRALKRGESRDVVIAVEIKPAAMKLI